jgi:endoglucanase
MMMNLVRGSVVGLALLSTATGCQPSSSAPVPTSEFAPTAGFFVPRPLAETREQIAELRAQGRDQDADLIEAMVAQPRAVWITTGTPRDLVSRTVEKAAATNRIPVLVAYNIPGRDCAGLSAGGATNTASYSAWIDAFAGGIADGRAVVILEPDSLGLLPSECGQNGGEFPFTDDARYRQLRYAVRRLGRQPRARVYLDGTHSHWLSVGDAASRLASAGITNADGFYTNVSNYRWTEYEVKFGTWISKCIAFATNSDDGGWRLGRYDRCASQYHSPLGDVDPDDVQTWRFTDEWYEANLGEARATTPFVIDTSRNGRGPWESEASYPDAQEWCNPPGRGVGPRPQAGTAIRLLDAFLWIKPPGESDGECTRGLGPSGTTVDPEWGQVDPPAGEWFPEQALQLARLADPEL